MSPDGQEGQEEARRPLRPQPSQAVLNFFQQFVHRQGPGGGIRAQGLARELEAEGLRPEPAAELAQTLSQLGDAFQRITVIDVHGYGLRAIFIDRDSGEMRPPVPLPHEIEQYYLALEAAGEIVIPGCLPFWSRPSGQEGCPVVLAGEGATIRIMGQEVPSLTGRTYRAVELLVNAYPDLVTTDRLEQLDISNVRDLRPSLIRRHIAWGLVFHSERGEGGQSRRARYGFRWPEMST